MDVRVFFKSLVLFTALALFIYALYPGSTLEFLLKLLALDVGISLVAPFAWPHIRGIRQGDAVLVAAEEEAIPFRLASGVALSNGRLGGTISVRLPDGRELECEVVSYSGLFMPARVRIAKKEFDVKVF